MATDKHAKIVIVGAGCFGLSTAYHLLRRGYTAITILDRSQVLPAPDAASTDINKSKFLVLYQSCIIVTLHSCSKLIRRELLHPTCPRRYRRMEEHR